MSCLSPNKQCKRCLINLVHDSKVQAIFFGEMTYKSSAVAEMGDRLATIGMARKWGGAAVDGWVPTGSPSNIM